MIPQKTSLLVNRQLPEFVRDEYPIFQSFLEAYYEFLENKQTGVNNDLMTRAKEIRTISDIDESLDDFEVNFLDTYAKYFPIDSAVSKDFLLKNLMPFYLAKGSEKSFKFLFRALFDTEIKIKRLSENIIRASDGEWKIENKIRIDKGFSTYSDADGINKIFNVLYSAAADQFRVYVGGILQSSSLYYVQPEAYKITFYTAPTSGQEVEIFCDDFAQFDPNTLASREIIGTNSDATAITEKVVEEKINDIEIFAFFISTNNIKGTFTNGEEVTLTAFNPNDELLYVRGQTVSILKSIDITDGGKDYVVGDIVRIIGGQSGNFQITPSAIVSEVFRGLISKIIINYGGAGFFVGDTIEPLNVSNTALLLGIESVNTAGQFSDTLTSNTYTIYTDLISSINLSNTLSVSNYGFPANVIIAGENVSTVISDALSNTSFVSIGPISNVVILTSNASFAVTPLVDATPASLLISTTRVSIRDFGSLARFKINGGGINYARGDELVFTNTIPMALGIGAAAAVQSVNGTGSITSILFQPTRIRGTANVSNVSAVITGTNTIFTEDLRVGNRISVNNQIRIVSGITNNISATVNANLTYTSTNSKIGLLDVYPLGGQNYSNDKLPIVTISSVAGTGANVQVTTIFGDGEQLVPTSTRPPGEILSITILNPGRGFSQRPEIDLTQSGDGTATAVAVIEFPKVELPGRFLSSRGIISAEEMRIQAGNTYHDYAYTISGNIEFTRYKDIIKQLLHPAGSQNNAEWTDIISIDTRSNGISAVSNTKSVSGKVAITNTRIYVTGTNTKFNVANSLGILTVGSNIAIDNQIRIVNNIISNTNISVSVAFTSNSNSQDLIVL